MSKQKEFYTAQELADKSKITYHCSRDFTTSFKNPEEKVRASFFTLSRHKHGFLVK